jgi:choline kinase
MTSPTRSAIILAAGQGIRLGEHGRNGPKALLEVGGRTLLSRSLGHLAGAGITRVLLVTGHKAEAFENLEVPQGLRVEKLRNPDFDDFGSLLSLVVGLRHMNEPCLILDGDIIYEPQALRAGLENQADNVMILSAPTGSGDEYYAWTDESSRLVSQSKQVGALPQAPMGESVGILKCGNALRLGILAAAESMLKNLALADYELAVCAAGQTHSIVCVRVDGLLWAEIDDEKMLAHARDAISPLIAEAENRLSGLVSA